MLKLSHKREAFLILDWKNAVQRLVQELNIAGFSYSIFGSLEMSYTLSTTNTVYGEYLTYLVFECLPYHIPILLITGMIGIYIYTYSFVHRHFTCFSVT